MASTCSGTPEAPAATRPADGRRRPAEEAVDDRGDAGLVPDGGRERVGLGERARRIGDGAPGRDQQQQHDPRRVTQHQMLRHHAAHRAAEQHDLLQAALVEQPGQAIGKGLHRIRPGLVRRGAEAGKVRG